MKREEVAKAINEDRVVLYHGGKYQVMGYKVIKWHGEKQHLVGILDLKNERTILWVGINDV